MKVTLVPYVRAGYFMKFVFFAYKVKKYPFVIMRGTVKAVTIDFTIYHAYYDFISLFDLNSAYYVLVI